MFIMAVLLLILIEDCPVAYKKEAVYATKPLIVELLILTSLW